eukprot:TRINITY_DN7930_c0_g1_i1.p1 TRINITY_DN7930_c0_g1~~TRINITY_DN7930_c0_g1_i1.p1  ORF type:complete len:2754 (-),score=377.10 TRINITY_DN7930_c0_g1_i1:392-8065(-)
MAPGLDPDLQRAAGIESTATVFRSLDASSHLESQRAQAIASTAALARRLSRSHRRRHATKKWSLSVFYHAVDSRRGVFTEDALNEIRHFEGVIKAFDGYTSHCIRPADVDDCKLADSVINMFFCVAESSNGTAKLSYDGKGELRNISATLRQLAKDDIPWWTDSYFSAANLTSQFTQSTFHGGVPLEGFPTTWTDSLEQARIHRQFLLKLYEEVLSPVDTGRSQLLKYKHIKISWYEPDIWDHEVRQCLLHDVLWCSGTFVMVFVLIILQLESLFLTLLGVLGVLLSFSTSYYFHYVVMGYRMLSVLDLLSLFLILGIAADDMFIMFHTYRLAPIGLDSLDAHQERMKYAYKEAGGAMIVTTLTSMGSFYANCVSMITLVRRFGFFMGTLILWNYINVMVIFSSAILVNDLYIVPGFRRCRSCCTKDSGSLEQDDGAQMQRCDSSQGTMDAPLFSDILSDASSNAPRLRLPSQKSLVTGSLPRRKRETTVTFQLSDGSSSSAKSPLPRGCRSQDTQRSRVTFETSDGSQESGRRSRAASHASGSRAATLSSGFRTTISIAAKTVRSVSTRAAGSVLVHRPLQEDEMNLLERIIYRRLHPLVATRHWVLISLCLLLSGLGVYFAFAGFTVAKGDLVIFPPDMNIGRVEEMYRKLFKQVDTESMEPTLAANYSPIWVQNRTSSSWKQVMPTIEVQSCRSDAEGKLCSGHGDCDSVLGSCRCEAGFVGRACSYKEKSATLEVPTAVEFLHFLSPPELSAAVVGTLTLEQTLELKSLGDHAFRWKAVVPTNQTWFSVVPKTGVLQAREFDAATDTPQPVSAFCTVVAKLDGLPAGWVGESGLEIDLEEDGSKWLVKVFARIALPAGLADLAVLPVQDTLGHEKVLMVPNFAISSGWPAPKYDVHIPFRARSVKIRALPLASTEEVWVNGTRVAGSNWTSQELTIAAGDFKSCAAVGSKCTCQGMARLGSGTIWSPWKESSGALECEAAFFTMPDSYGASSNRCECQADEEQWSTITVTARAISSNQATLYKLRIRRYQPERAPAVSVVRLVAAGSIADVTFAPVTEMQVAGYLPEATAENRLKTIIYPVSSCMPAACWDWQLLRPLPGKSCCTVRLANLTNDVAWSFSVKAVIEFGLGPPSIPSMDVAGTSPPSSDSGLFSWAPLSVQVLPRAPSILAAPSVEVHHGFVVLRLPRHQVLPGSSLPLGLLRCISTPGDIRSDNQSVYVTALGAWEVAVRGLDVDLNYTFRCAMADSHQAAPAQVNEWLSTSSLSAPTQAVQPAVHAPSAPKVLLVSLHRDSTLPRVRVMSEAPFLDRMDCHLRAGSAVISKAVDIVPRSTAATRTVERSVQLEQQTDGIAASGQQNISCRARVFDPGLPNGGHLWGPSKDVSLPQRPASPAIVFVGMFVSSLTVNISWIHDGHSSPSSFWCEAEGFGVPPVEGSVDLNDTADGTVLNASLVMEGLVADASYFVACTVRRQGKLGLTAYLLESRPGLASQVDGKASNPVLSAPPAPVIVGVEPSGDRAVLIRLDAGLELLHYCASVQSPGLAASGVGTAVLVFGLTAGLEYSFTCTASNSKGTSAPSNASAAIVAARPPGAPGILSVIPKSAQLEVDLLPPGLPSARGFATIRKLSCVTDSGIGASTELTHPNQSYRVTVQGLPNGVAVRVRCRAESAAGAGQWSEFADPVMPGVPVAARYNFSSDSSTIGQLHARIAAELGLPLSQVSIVPQGRTRRLAAEENVVRRLGIENTSQQLASGIIEVRVAVESNRDQRIPDVMTQMNNLRRLSSLTEVDKAKVLDETFTDSRLRELAVVEDTDSRVLVAVSPPLPSQTGNQDDLKFSAVVSSVRFAVHAIASSHLATIELLDEESSASQRFEISHVLPATRNVSVRVTAADRSSTLYLLAVGMQALACGSSCGHGQCNRLRGQCDCDPGWKGEACMSYCPGTPTCGGPSRGACLADPRTNVSRCVCNETYGGSDGDCSSRVCPRCANNGSCVPGTQEEASPWTCRCPATYAGPLCKQALCPGNCSGAGTCDESTGKCSCWEGASGPDCSTPEPYKEPLANCVQVSLVWGIKGYEAATSGETPTPDFDQSFKLFDPAVQKYLLSVSTMVRNDSLLLVREDVPTWIEAWRKFVFSRGGAFPVTDYDLASQGLQAFMHGLGQSFEQDVGTQGENFSGRPTFARLRLVLNLPQDGGPQQLQAVRTRWQNIVKMLNEENDIDGAGPILMVSESWTKTELEQGIVAKTGEAFLVSVGITLICVVVFTGNIVIALHVLFTILLTVCVLFGFVFGVVGYEFGAVEATGCVLFVGLSVDYCLHLAHGYHTACEDTRASKLRQALVNLGPSIIGGGITTIAGTAFLLPCRIVLFVKLGTMLVGNALLSLTYTFFYLAPMLALAGPMDDFGSVRQLVYIPVKAIACLFAPFLKRISLRQLIAKRTYNLRRSQPLEDVFGTARPRASSMFQRFASSGASAGPTSLLSDVEEELGASLNSAGIKSARITCRALPVSPGGLGAAATGHQVFSAASNKASPRPPRVTRRLQPRRTGQDAQTSPLPAKSDP